MLEANRLVLYFINNLLRQSWLPSYLCKGIQDRPLLSVTSSRSTSILLLGKSHGYMYPHYMNINFLVCIYLFVDLLIGVWQIANQSCSMIIIANEQMSSIVRCVEFQIRNATAAKMLHTQIITIQ